MSDYLGMGISRFHCSMCGMCDIPQVGLGDRVQPDCLPACREGPLPLIQF